MKNNILVLAAHPDDEVLGCGGTIAKYVSQGDFVHVAFISDGVFSRQGDEDALAKELESRRSAAYSALSILGVTSISFGEFPDNRLDTVATIEVAQMIEALITEHQPKIVFTIILETSMLITKWFMKLQLLPVDLSRIFV